MLNHLKPIDIYYSMMYNIYRKKRESKESEEKKMKEMFEKMFEEVMDELGYEDWWELFDGKDFHKVEDRISEKLGYDCWDNEEFCDWTGEMADDL